MRVRPILLWYRARDSLWFTPVLMTLGACVLALLLVRVDVAYLGAELARDNWWLFGAGPDGARGMLTTIAGSVITVAGVVFSITIVALQLASTQFTPRVLQNFLGDRGNQLVLGIFVGTFAYTLLVLRTVRSPDDAGNGGFVPYLASTVAIIFALLSMGVLIYFLNHVSGWIAASGIIDRVTRETMHEIREHFPLAAGTGGPAAPDAGEGEPAVLLARGSGYVEAIDDRTLLRLAARHDLIVRLEHGIGDFVVEATPLLRAWPRERVGDDVEDELRRSVALGSWRTIKLDPALGILQLADIAVKAMSPSVNDPTTAMMAIDRLGAIVAELAGRYPGARVQVDDAGVARVSQPAFEFDDAVELAFGQVRRYAAEDPAVLAHLARTLAVIAPRVDADGRHCLRATIAAIELHAAAIEHAADRARLESALRLATDALA